MAKRRADDATVMAFLAAVFPGHAELARASFDEGHCLRVATAMLHRLAAAEAVCEAAEDAARGYWHEKLEDALAAWRATR